MDIKQIRLSNLLALIEEYDGKTALAEHVDVNQSYISQLTTDTKLPSGNKKSVGDVFARKLEEACKKPYGWMDQLHTGTELTDPSTINVSGTEVLIATQYINKHMKAEYEALSYDEQSDVLFKLLQLFKDAGSKSLEPATIKKLILPA